MDSRMKVVIIDDEQHCVDILVAMLGRHFPDVTVAAGCNSVTEGRKAIDRHHPDLVFLDVEMPHDNGFELLRQFDRMTFDVIFTTAFENYALRAIKFSALDYLLKPFSMEELTQAVNKHREKKEGQGLLPAGQMEAFLENLGALKQGLRKIALPLISGLVFVAVGDIIRCEAIGNYTKIYFQDKTSRTVSKSLKEFEVLLEDMGFFRVHHSHLINLHHMQSYLQGEGGSAVMKDGTHVEISRRRKAEFLRRITQL